MSPHFVLMCTLILPSFFSILLRQWPMVSWLAWWCVPDALFNPKCPVLSRLIPLSLSLALSLSTICPSALLPFVLFDLFPTCYFLYFPWLFPALSPLLFSSCSFPIVPFSALCSLPLFSVFCSFRPLSFTTLSLLPLPPLSFIISSSFLEALQMALSLVDRSVIQEDDTWRRGGLLRMPFEP